MRFLISLLAILVTTATCGGDDPAGRSQSDDVNTTDPNDTGDADTGDDTDTDDGTDTGDGTDTDSTHCTLIESIPILEPHAHVPLGTALSYQANPPASGAHYDLWARYRAFADAVPREYWVHNLYHGGVVLLYRPDARAETIAALTSAYEALPADAGCGHTWALLTIDPELDDEFAIVALGVVLTGDCVEVSAAVDWIVGNRGAVDEPICDHGVYGG